MATFEQMDANQAACPKLWLGILAVCMHLSCNFVGQMGLFVKRRDTFRELVHMTKEGFFVLAHTDACC